MSEELHRFIMDRLASSSVYKETDGSDGKAARRIEGAIGDVAAVVKGIVRAVQDDALFVLRLARDSAPREWDALTKSAAGPEIMNLWDRLKARAPFQGRLCFYHDADLDVRGFKLVAADELKEEDCSKVDAMKIYTTEENCPACREWIARRRAGKTA